MTLVLPTYDAGEEIGCQHRMYLRARRNSALAASSFSRSVWGAAVGMGGSTRPLPKPDLLPSPEPVAVTGECGCDGTRRGSPLDVGSRLTALRLPVLTPCSPAALGDCLMVERAFLRETVRPCSDHLLQL